MSDYQLHMLIQAGTSALVVVSAVVLAIAGTITGADAMVVLLGTAGFGATGAVVLSGTMDRGSRPGPPEVHGDPDHPAGG